MFFFHLYIIRHNNSCVSIVFGIQLQQNLCRSPVPSLWVCLCVSVTEGRGRNKHTCSSWQIKMNSVVLGSGSLFIIFHFTQRASQTSAAACHVKTLYQVLTAPPMHTHRMHGSYTLWLCSRPLPLTLLHMQGAYVAIYLTSTPSCTALSTLCLSPPLLFSHFSSGGKSVFLFFGLSPPPQSWLSSATCLPSRSTYTGAAFIPARGASSGIFCQKHACLREAEAMLKELSDLGCAQVCLLACFLDWGVF